MRATFSIDERTHRALERVSEALGKSKSEVVREAVIEYEARRDRLTEEERRRQLAAIAEIRASPPSRSDESMKAELREIRRSRRGPGRATEAE